MVDHRPILVTGSHLSGTTWVGRMIAVSPCVAYLHEPFNLNSNQLDSLPESIGQLANLTLLYLDENKLTSLPESIGNLTNLTWLNLRRNQLTRLPESIGNLKNLIWLNLRENKLSQSEKDKIRKQLPNCEIIF